MLNFSFYENSKTDFWRKYANKIYKKKTFTPFLWSFFTLIAARLKYLKHQGTKSNCFYIIILKNILRTSSFGPFWRFLPKTQYFSGFFKAGPLYGKRSGLLIPKFKSCCIILLFFMIFEHIHPIYFNLEHFFCKNWHEN